MGDSLFRLDGRTAIVTGASYGLGVTIARALAEAGANVVLAARSADKLEQVRQSLASLEVDTLAVGCDVGDAESVRAMVAAAWDRFGQVEVLVNNAGQLLDGGVVPEKVEDAILEQTLAVNVVGTFRCAREVAARQLAAGVKGSIVNVSSVAGLAGNSPAAYGTSKAALINMTRVLAAAWADRGIRVNALCPGWFPSEMTGPWLSIPEVARYCADSAPMRRVGEPAELAGPIVFLASDASTFMTGQALTVDGGATATVGALPLDDSVQATIRAAVGDLAVPIAPQSE